MLIVLSTYITFCFLKVQCKHEVIKILCLGDAVVFKQPLSKEDRGVRSTYAQMHIFKVKYCNEEFIVSLILVMSP